VKVAGMYSQIVPAATFALCCLCVLALCFILVSLFAEDTTTKALLRLRRIRKRKHRQILLIIFCQAQAKSHNDTEGKSTTGN